MAMPPKLGGCGLPQPRMFLLWQHATPFIRSRQEPQRIPLMSKQHLDLWAHMYGVPLDGRYLPWLQLGPIPWKTYPFLGTSYEAFSCSGKQHQSPAPERTCWTTCHRGTCGETEKGVAGAPPPPFSDWVDPDSKPNTCRWSNCTRGVFIASWVPTCGKFSVPVQTAQMGRFCICLLGPPGGFPEALFDWEPLLKMTSWPTF